MDFKAIIQEDKEKIQLQNKIIKDYKKLLNINLKLSDKFLIDDSFKDEVLNYFISNGFEKSETDHEGKNFSSTCTTYFKYSDDDMKGQYIYISVTFGDLSDYEKSISIIRHSTGSHYAFVYTLEKNENDLLCFKVNTTLNGDPILLDNYEKKISECNSIKELSNLERQIKENIEDFETKLSEDFKVSSVYKLRSGSKFDTFEEALSALN